jgi:hypothetical protein
VHVRRFLTNCLLNEGGFDSGGVNGRFVLLPTQLLQQQWQEIVVVGSEGRNGRYIHPEKIKPNRRMAIASVDFGVVPLFRRLVRAMEMEKSAVVQFRFAKISHIALLFPQK